MTKYEELIEEYSELSIEERSMLNKGLYCDNVIWINQNLNTSEKKCILAEELGHYETSSGNILDQANISNRKQELNARRWAYKKLLPYEKLLDAISQGYRQTWEIAEYLDVDEAFLLDALKYYNII